MHLEGQHLTVQVRLITGVAWFDYGVVFQEASFFQKSLDAPDQKRGKRIFVMDSPSYEEDFKLCLQVKVRGKAH